MQGWCHVDLGICSTLAKSSAYSFTRNLLELYLFPLPASENDIVEEKLTFGVDMHTYISRFFSLSTVSSTSLLTLECQFGNSTLRFKSAFWQDVWSKTLVSCTSLKLKVLLLRFLRREQDKEATVYIGNIDERVTDALIWELMLQAGRIVNVHLPKDRVTQSHQGYGFVEFVSEEDAEYAARIMNQVRLYGKPIRVNKVSTDF